MKELKRTMKYLFFDIECSNCINGIGKMCEFGYVLTDERLKILSQDDIPMSPGEGRENRFILTGRKNERDLQLAYDEEFYFSQPEFPFFFNRIKKLVEDPDTICFAFSMENDIAHLYHSCTRYKKEPFNYICYDVQKMASKYLEEKQQVSLKHACLEIVGPHSTMNLIEHLSRDDAKMELLVFEAISVLEQISPKELLDISESAKTNSAEFMKEAKERARKKHEKNQGHILYRKYIVRDEELDKEEYIGRRYNVSGKIKSNLDAVKKAIAYIRNKKGIFSNRLDKTDYFIVLDDANKEEIIQSINNNYTGKFITLDELKPE